MTAQSRSDTGARPWRAEPDGVVIRFRLTPKGGRDAVDGVTDTADGPAFKARVRAAPEDGAANAGLERLVADWLGVAGRSAALAAGHKSRVKSVRVEGDPAALAAALVDRLQALQR